MIAAVIMATVMVSANSGAAYYTLEQLTGIQLRSPLPLYGSLALAVLLTFRPFARDSALVFASFAALIVYFLVTASWSDSQVYRDEKLLRTFLVPPLWLLASYAIARRLGLTTAAKAAGIFGLFVVLAVSASGQPLEDSLSALLYDRTGIFDYQRLGIVTGIGAAMLMPLAGRNVWTPIMILLAVMALSSGGRTGILLLLAGVAVQMAHRTRPILWVPVLTVGFMLAFVGSEALLDFLWVQAKAVGAPASIERALYAAERAPDVTRVWGRNEFLRAGIETWLANPLFGVGWGGFPTAVGLPDEEGYYVHNLIVELLSETGMVGFIATAAVGWIVFSRRFALQAVTFDARRKVMIIDTAFFCGFLTAQFVGDFPSQLLVFLSAGFLLGTWDAVMSPATANRRAKTGSVP